MALSAPSSSNPWETDNSQPLKRRKTADWVVTMAVGEMDDLAYLPLVEEDPEAEVVCLSQVSRKLSDPGVGSRDCILTGADGTRPWKGVLLQDFIRNVAEELQQKTRNLVLEEGLKNLVHERVTVVVYEAYKLLEEDFTEVMRSILGLNANQKFVRRFRSAIAKAAKIHGWSYSTSTPWIQQNVPFGIFVEGVRLLLDAQSSTEDVKLKVQALRDEGMKMFEYILGEGLQSLQEDYESCNTPSPMILDTLDFLREPGNAEAAVREFAACARLRQGRNEYSHPFSSIASKAIRESAMTFYTSFLSSEYTKEFPHIAVIGQVKLDILGFSKEKMKPDSENDGAQFLEYDSGIHCSDEDLSPKASGLWES